MNNNSPSDSCITFRAWKKKNEKDNNDQEYVNTEYFV